MQVLNEFFITVTGKLSPGFDRAEAWADMQDLMSWELQPIDRVRVVNPFTGAAAATLLG